MLIALGVSSPSSARADEQSSTATAGDEQRADAIFGAAREAFKAEDFVGAAELFRRAFTLRPSANTKFNEAQSWRRGGRKARAADAYAEALALGGLDESLAEAGQRQLDKLVPELARVRLDGPAGARVSVAHVRDRALPIRLHLVPGRHRVEVVSVDGTRFSESLEVNAGAEHERRLRPPEPAVPGASAPDQGAPVTWILGWTALGIGAAGGIVAGALGARFSAVLDDYEASGLSDTALEDEALRLRLATNAVAFTSAALGLLGGTLIIVDLATSDGDDPTASNPKKPKVCVRVAPGGVFLHGSW